MFKSYQKNKQSNSSQIVDIILTLQCNHYRESGHKPTWRPVTTAGWLKPAPERLRPALDRPDPIPRRLELAPKRPEPTSGLEMPNLAPWRSELVSRVIALIVNYIQRLKSELTAKSTTKIFFEYVFSFTDIKRTR